jgi:endogenous inhibitor of DNA gyrase (YacG/DUF329 family)
MRQCPMCGKPLVKRSRKVYCSVRCQWDLERSARLAAWLKTGQATPGSGRGHDIRTHILEEQLGCCDVGGIVDEWNGAPLALVLDHIDGDSGNNLRANLRLICPNCDSQLPTYKSRNRGNGRYARRQRYANGQSH